jgi:hypothetical protein
LSSRGDKRGRIESILKQGLGDTLSPTPSQVTRWGDSILGKTGSKVPPSRGSHESTGQNFQPKISRLVSYYKFAKYKKINRLEQKLSNRRWQLQSPNAMSMVCERGWGGQATDLYTYSR